MRGITLTTLVLALVALGVLSGCGGGSGLTPVGAGKNGGATVTIKWPTRGRLIPLASNSIKVIVDDGQGFVTSQVADRPEGGGNSTLHFDNLPSAWVTIAAIAYPQVGAQGVAQASGAVSTYIYANSTADVVMSMDSTIRRVDLLGDFIVGIGETSTLNPAAKNSNGEVVVVPVDGYTWESADPSIATVDVTTGVVTGVKAGTVTITARDKESYVAGSVLVTVTDASNPVSWATGEINTATVWTGTVYVTGDVSIRANGNLTITPGTRVLMAPRSDDQFGGANTSRITITVQGDGILTAEGTAEQPIVFTSAAPTNPLPGDWEGINTEAGATSLKFCNIAYGRHNVYFQGGSNTMEDCVSSNSSEVSAIFECKQLNGDPLNIQRCTFRNRYMRSYSLDAITFTDCQFLNSDYIGAYVGNATFVNCTARGCGSWGIHGNGNVVLTNCTVENNYYGVYGGGGVWLDGCRIQHNSDWGTYYVKSAVNSVIAYNNVGMQVRDWDSDTTIDNCLIYGNQIGVRFSNGTPVVRVAGSSDIYGNIQYDVQNVNSSGVSFQGTGYWGDQSRDELAAHIDNLTCVYDSRDNAGYGQVGITTWADTRVTEFPLPARSRARGK
jgi:hypothetical protein